MLENPTFENEVRTTGSRARSCAVRRGAPCYAGSGKTVGVYSELEWGSRAGFGARE